MNSINSKTFKISLRSPWCLFKSLYC